MTSTADILDRAADLIDELGWHKGKGNMGDRRLCIGQAVAMAVTEIGGWEYVEPNPYKVLTIHIFGEERHADSLVRWQDARARTQSDVTGALRNTAKELRNAQ